MTIYESKKMWSNSISNSVEKRIITVKKFSEVFPDIDIRAFEAMMALSEKKAVIEVTVDGVKYSSDFSSKEYEVVVNENGVLTCSVISDEEIEDIDILEDWVATSRIEKSEEIYENSSDSFESIYDMAKLWQSVGKGNSEEFLKYFEDIFKK